MKFIGNLLHKILRAFGFKKIKHQILFLNAFLFLVGAGAIGSIYLSIQSDAATVNLAGRQRMLSQRVAKEAMMVVQGVENKTVVDETVALFERSHQALLKGDAASGIEAVEDRAARAQLEKVAQLWNSYRQNLYDYVGHSNSKLLTDIRDTAPIVLVEMNRAVNMLEALADQKIVRQARNAVIMIASILFISLLIFFYVTGRLVLPLVRLSTMFEQVASGDISQRIPDDKGEDEVAYTFQAYNAMLNKFARMVDKIIRSAVSVGTESARLGSAAQVSASGMKQQYVEIEQISTAMNEMSATVQDVSRSIAHAADQASQADQEASKGRTVMEQTSQVIAELNNQVKSVGGVIKALNSDSQEISMVLEVINAIAEQTNLLALNAAIEAARAGDRGRGFAVVADEVRTLAARTGESTQEIRLIIERLQKQSKEAVAAIETGQETARTGVEQVNEADAALTRIAKSVAAISEMNTQIATAAEEQSHVAEEMNRNIVRIANVSERTYSSSEENLTATARIAESVETLREISSCFHNNDSSLELERAKAAYLAWRGRIRSFLDGKGNLTKEEDASHRHGVFGKWYYGEESKHFGHIPEMRAIEQPHTELHELIKRIIDLKEAGKSEEAEAAFGGIGPLSEAMVSFIDRIEDRIRRDEPQRNWS
jgi:methyl-accepting chemotaxis protein